MRYQIIIIITCIISKNIFGWGFLGHRSIAKITKIHLTTKTLFELKKLQNQDTLEQLSVWPDAIRSYYPETTKWHYTVIHKQQNIPNSKDGLIYEQLCKNIAILSRKSEHWQNRHRALSWVIHLVGDMHQPLHIGNGRDFGGNTCNIFWYKRKKPVTLHKVWDNYLVKYTIRINPNLTYKKLSISQINSSAIQWMHESRNLHKLIYPPRQHSYCFKQTHNIPKLDEKYATKMAKNVVARLQLASQRLAYILNYIFDESFQKNHKEPKTLIDCQVYNGKKS